MNFTKMQATGNDFILVKSTDVEQNWPRLAKAMCDRHFGIGADGLLLVLPSDTADLKMRVFNPDGSEAETCGNGLRCVAKYASDKKLIDTNVQEMSIESIAGVREVKLYKAGGSGVTTVQVGMGKPRFGVGDTLVEVGQNTNLVDIKSILSYPVTIGHRKLLLDLISLGNPHAVYFWQHSISGFPLSQLGPKVGQLTIFPDGVNFEVARVMGRQQMECRVWERGAGETLACGSGACAVAVAAYLHGYIDSEVDIKLPGGILNVEWDGVGEVFLSGSAKIVFSGEWLGEV